MLKRLFNWKYLVHCNLIAYLILGLLGVYLWGFFKGFGIILMPWTIVFENAMFRAKEKKQRKTFGILFL